MSDYTGPNAMLDRIAELEAENERMRADLTHASVHAKEYAERTFKAKAENERLWAAMADVRELLHDTDLPLKDRVNNAITVIALALERKP